MKQGICLDFFVLSAFAFLRGFCFGAIGMRGVIRRKPFLVSARWMIGELMLPFFASLVPKFVPQGVDIGRRVR